MELSKWREELAGVLARHYRMTGHAGPWCGGCKRTIEGRWDDHLAQALLASPAMARLLAEVRAEAWDEGYVTHGYVRDFHKARPNPYRTNAHPTDDHAGEAK